MSNRLEHGNVIKRYINRTIIIIISKFRQKFKNHLIVKKATSQVNDIIVDACMQFKKNQIKTVGEEAFFSY